MQAQRNAVEPLSRGSRGAAGGMRTRNAEPGDFQGVCPELSARAGVRHALGMGGPVSAQLWDPWS